MIEVVMTTPDPPDPRVTENATATRDAKEMMQFIGEQSPKFWARFYKLVQKKARPRKTPAKKRVRREP